MKRPTYSTRILGTVVLLLSSFVGAHGFDDPELLIPAKTKLSLQLLSPISTATSKKGDKFSCKILTPAEFAGAIAEGHVRSVKRSGKADKESKLDLAFDTLTLIDGRVANFSATVVEVFDVVNAREQGRADNEGTIRNKSTTVKTSIKRAAVGALIGALVGGAVAGGQGAAVGAAIGASIGATTTLATKGADLEFKVGTEFTVETDGPSRRTTTKSPAPLTAASNGSGTTSTQPGSPPALKENADIRNLAATPPAIPSSQSRLYVTQFFRTNIPENWREFSNNPVTLGPEGSHGLNNGRPEITHGVIIGIAPWPSNDLKQASEQLATAVVKGNPHMQRQGNGSASVVGGRAAMVNVFSGRGSQGKIEVVTVHALLLGGGRLFYTIAVVPEQEIDSYRDAFSKLVSSIEFIN
jgi:outer membrane lipoprotein SlyB